MNILFYKYLYFNKFFLYLKSFVIKIKAIIIRYIYIINNFNNNYCFTK